MKVKMPVLVAWYSFSFLIILFLVGCDEHEPSNAVENTIFKFQLKGEMKGEITHKNGVAKVSCEGDRTVITFTESIENRADSTDFLVGEIILGIQKDDSTGTFTLQGITEDRLPNRIGIVALPNQVVYDELAGTYISNPQRFQTVKEGAVTINQWGSEANELIDGSLWVVFNDNDKTIIMEGIFAVKLSSEDSVCEVGLR